MSLLDDLVKNKFGSPLADSMQSIALQGRERRAGEDFAPIVQEYNKKLTQIAASGKPPTPEEMSLLTGRTLGQMLEVAGPGGMATQAGQYTKGTMMSMADLILKGSKEGAEQRLQTAQGQQATSTANKYTEETRQAQKELPLAIQKEYGVPNYGALTALAPHIQREVQLKVAKMQLEASNAGNERQREQTANELGSVLIKNLDEYAINMGKVRKKIMDNPLDIEGMLDVIMESNPDKGKRSKVRDRIQQSYVDWSNSKTGELQAIGYKYNVNMQAVNDAAKSVDERIFQDPSLAPIRYQLIEKEVQTRQGAATGTPIVDRDFEEWKKFRADKEAKATGAAAADSVKTVADTAEEKKSAYELLLKDEYGVTKAEREEFARSQAASRERLSKLLPTPINTPRKESKRTR